MKDGFASVHERVVMARMMRALRATVLFRHGISENELRAYNSAKIVLGAILGGLCLILAASVAHASPCEGKCRDIAVILAGEAAGEKEIGMRAVASTIRNRAALSGKSAHYEATKKNQYYGHTAKNRFRLYAQFRPVADKIALELISGRLKDTVNGGLYFRTAKEKRFKWCKVETARVFNHIFYK